MKRPSPLSVWPAACALLLAAGARADLPSIPNVIVPPGLPLVGTSAGVADPNGTFVVVVHDAFNVPVANAVVELDGSACANDPARDLWLAQTQPYPAVIADCAHHKVSAITGLDGRATFRVVGTALAVRGAPGITTGCVTVRVDGVLVNNGVPIRLSAFDQDGSGGVAAGDLSLFMDRLFQSPAGYSTRADFNGDGLCNSGDLALMLRVLMQAGSTASGGALCP